MSKDNKVDLTKLTKIPRTLGAIDDALTSRLVSSLNKAICPAGRSPDETLESVSALNYAQGQIYRDLQGMGLHHLYSFGEECFLVFSFSYAMGQAISNYQLGGDFQLSKKPVTKITSIEKKLLAEVSARMALSMNQIIRVPILIQNQLNTYHIELLQKKLPKVSYQEMRWSLSTTASDVSQQFTCSILFRKKNPFV